MRDFQDEVQNPLSTDPDEPAVTLKNLFAAWRPHGTEADKQAAPAAALATPSCTVKAPPPRVYYQGREVCRNLIDTTPTCISAEKVVANLVALIILPEWRGLYSP